MVSLGELAGQVCCAVGGDGAADAKEDSCHGATIRSFGVESSGECLALFRSVPDEGCVDGRGTAARVATLEAEKMVLFVPLIVAFRSAYLGWKVRDDAVWQIQVE